MRKATYERIAVDTPIDARPKSVKMERNEAQKVMPLSKLIIPARGFRVCWSTDHLLFEESTTLIWNKSDVVMRVKISKDFRTALDCRQSSQLELLTHLSSLRKQIE